MKTITFLSLIAGASLFRASCGNSNKVDEKTAQELNAQIDAMNQEGQKVAQENAQKGAKYIEEQMKADPELKKTKSGLVYKITEPGEGKQFTEADNVTVHYTGKHIDGSTFDSSVDRGEPATFPVTGVVPGFKEMLMMMRPGAKAHCIIPGNLGYGEQGNQVIGPNEVLVFDIEAIGLGK